MSYFHNSAKNLGRLYMLQLISVDSRHFTLKVQFKVPFVRATGQTHSENRSYMQEDI